MPFPRNVWLLRVAIEVVLHSARLIAFVSIPFLLSAACSDSFVIAEERNDAGPSSFGDTPDAAVDVSELISYCPTNKCPKGHTTCPSSAFPCDVNLLADIHNCGACGVVCPTPRHGATYDCVDGMCVMTCHTTDDLRPVGDCDGIIDNGCETLLETDDNCKACGKKCAPGEHCVVRGQHDVGCGCHDNQMYCQLYPGGPHGCVEIRDDDAHCGTCQNACDYTGGGASLPPHSYYGCINSTCGNLKCHSRWGNCDGAADTGCETFLVTNENCGACGRACPADQECRLNPQLVPECMCPEGETFCSGGTDDGVEVGACRNLLSDSAACGDCSKACNLGLAHGKESCVNGICRPNCAHGWADCNGDTLDGCETNVDSDPSNCGGCDNKCNAVAGQACAGGRCVVEPCKEPGGMTQ